MKPTRDSILLTVAVLLATPWVLNAQTPLGTSFTYQGQLKHGGQPVNDTADFEFSLWDAETGGVQVGPTVPVNNWLIEGGLFTVLLDFGEGVFTGDACWLEIAVRSPAGNGEFTTLSPRQPLTATAYALYALSGPGSGGYWAADGDDIYNTNSGNVGIGTPTPSYPLHIEGDGTRVVYVRSHAASARALHASSNGTAVYASGGSCGLDAYTDSPTGNAVYAFNEAESGNAYAIYGENGSPTGTAIYGIAGNDDQYSTGIGVYGRSDSDGGTGVYGEATHATGPTYGVRGQTSSSNGYGVHGYASATSGANRGVYGKTDSYDGHAGYFENTSSGSYGALAGDAHGVQGRGNTAGGFFEDGGGSTYAYVGHSDQGIRAFGAGGGGYFEDISASGHAYLGYGNLGVDAAGTEAGGHFLDEDHLGEAYVGYGGSGIEAKGSVTGGSFENTSSSAFAYAANGDYGIAALGPEAGAFFRDLTGNGYAYLGRGDRGIEAFGTTGGGYFEDTNNTGYAYVAVGRHGIEAYGDAAAAYFQETDGTGYAYVGIDDHGIEAAGSDAGAVFVDTDGSGQAYIGCGDRGIEAFGDFAGGYFADTDASGYAYVGYGDRGIEAHGSLGGGYFEDTDSSAYAYVGRGEKGVSGYGATSGGVFEDTNSSSYANVGASNYKITGSGLVSFVQNHPDDADKVIVYACPEGDEAATYTRGTARLVDGRAVVPLGETFKWVTNPDIGLTAHLTPHDYAVPLAVVSLTTEKLVVRGPQDGPDDVVFDYLVYGLRIGFEETSIVQEKEREAYIPSMADHRALYERCPELRDYNALERFRRMHAAAGQTMPLDLSAAQALHDAIVEFDPAVHSFDERRELEARETIEMGADQPREQRRHGPELVDPKDTELAELRARVKALEAVVARLSVPQNGGEQRMARTPQSSPR